MTGVKLYKLNFNSGNQLKDLQTFALCTLFKLLLKTQHIVPFGNKIIIITAMEETCYQIQNKNKADHLRGDVTNILKKGQNLQNLTSLQNPHE